ncbi:Phosphoglycerate kinase [Durusdinium trenchii]|uniref:Phosphoglycerate kinase n=1 Tax=Durusdinium trenchii TaxID=1381693 RepID=A0ABP0KVK0_9DINO
MIVFWHSWAEQTSLWHRHSTEDGDGQSLMTPKAQEKQSSEGKTSLVFLASGASERVLSELALELGRTARLVVEHSRTVWGLKQLVLELSGVYPNIQSQLPTYRIQPFYGRHFDVLEALLSSLEEGPELRMAELGVACGPIGLHLLARFSGLQYYGADPTIKEEVREAYQPYAERAQLFATTSEEMHTRLSDGPLMDFVFIDGPHTYANVRNAAGPDRTGPVRDRCGRLGWMMNALDASDGRRIDGR